MPGRVDGLAHGGDVGGDAGRGLVVHHAHGLDARARCRRAAAPRSGRPARRGASRSACRRASVPDRGTRASGRGAWPSSATALAKWPVSNISTASPGLSVLPAPPPMRRCPRPDRSTTGWRVWKICWMPASTCRPSAPNSGPRWSMVGRLIARRMRSGTGLGPGICRKWRPVGWWSSVEHRVVLRGQISVRRFFAYKIHLSSCNRHTYDDQAFAAGMFLHTKCAP